MPGKLTSQEFRDKWKRRTKDAQGDYRDGIARVNEAPGKKAVEKQDKLQRNFNDAVDSGKWKRNTEAVTLEDWKQPTLKKGVQNFSTGVEAAGDKVLAFAEELDAVLSLVRSKVDKMPDETFGERMERMHTQAEMMHEWGERRKGRT